MLSSSMEVKLYCSLCLVEVIIRVPLHADNGFFILAVERLPGVGNLNQQMLYQRSLTVQGSSLQQGGRSLSGISCTLKVV